MVFTFNEQTVDIPSNLVKRFKKETLIDLNDDYVSQFIDYGQFVEDIEDPIKAFECGMENFLAEE